MRRSTALAIFSLVVSGARTAVTSAAGDYILPPLPPGDYTVSFDLEGMQRVTKSVRLTAARTDTIDAALKPSAVTESITVTATTPSVVESTEVSTNLKQHLVEQLPAFNPFTETPVEGVHYIKGPNFGRPASELDYQTPRTFRVSLGLRF